MDSIRMRRRRRAYHPKAGAEGWQGRAWHIAFWMMWPALVGVAILTYPTTNRANAYLPGGGASATAQQQGSRPGAAQQRPGAIPTRERTAAEEAALAGRVHSRCRIHAAASGSGLVNKYYHRFENVQLTQEKLTVFYPPEFTPPQGEVWVDIISGNATHPVLPTMYSIKGDLHTKKWFWLPVEYLPAVEHQPQCTSWVDAPTYLLQVRYSYNIWHTWNEGLMGIFQTLRELGHLPLAAVGERGDMEEILDGMGGGCAWEYDPSAGRVVRPEACPPRQGLLPRQRCDPAAEAWCRPGAVVSALRAAGGPSILPFTPGSVVNVWGHLYRAMSESVLDWGTAEGACFRDLIVGKSPTLNFYQVLNDTALDPGALKAHPRVDNRAERVEAMAVFKAFVTSAQREWAAAERERDPSAPEWGGYRVPGMERLRRGVGPEDAGDEATLASINPWEVPGMLREEIDDLRKLWLKRMAWTEPEVIKFRERFGGAAEARAAAKEQGIEVEPDYYDDYDAKAALALRLAERARSGSGGGSGGEAGSQRKRATMREADGAAAREAAERLEQDRAALQFQQQNQQQQQQQQEQRRRSSRQRRMLLSSLDGSAVQPQQRRSVQQAAPASPRRWFDANAVFRHERPRPVVTYMSRNFFSRGVLNERDVLDYILVRYNVTLRVTTFEEPLVEVMALLGATDVMFGMHGAGWTNGLFIKRGATTQQLFPFGWRLPSNATVRGYNYREIVLASQCPYSEWVNPARELAFFRRIDYTKKENLTYSVHPDPEWPLPHDSWPGNPWIYQNTYLDMERYGPYIDAMMAQAGIAPMPSAPRSAKYGSGGAAGRAAVAP